MNDQDIKEKLVDMPPEERAKAWETYVRDEINKVLDTYLPESITGTWGIKYDNPIISVDPATSKQTIDTTKASGVHIVIHLEFADVIQFSEPKPE
jgi:hypothetical protein